MTAIRCTAPRQGHRPGSAAERACPEHGKQASREVLPVAVAAPMPSDEPTVVERYSDGSVRSEDWYVDGKLHRTDGPAVVEYRPDGTVRAEVWFVDDKPHRIDGPARVWYHPDGTVRSEEWYVDGKAVESWEVLGRYLRRRGVPGLSTEALRQIAKDVPWQRWSELVSDHPLVALWSTVHPTADASAG